MDSIAHRITKNAILGGRRRTGQSCRYNKTILWLSDESWTSLVTKYPTKYILRVITHLFYVGLLVVW